MRSVVQSGVESIRAWKALAASIAIAFICACATTPPPSGRCTLIHAIRDAARSPEGADRYSFALLSVWPPSGGPEPRAFAAALRAEGVITSDDELDQLTPYGSTRATRCPGIPTRRPNAHTAVIVWGEPYIDAARRVALIGATTTVGGPFPSSDQYFCRLEATTAGWRLMKCALVGHDEF